MIAVLSVEVLPPDTPISLNPTIEFGGKFGILRMSRVPLVILLVFKSGMRVGDNSPLVILLALMFGINAKGRRSPFRIIKTTKNHGESIFQSLLRVQDTGFLRLRNFVCEDSYGINL
jgi:hypothetical protein